MLPQCRLSIGQCAFIHVCLEFRVATLMEILIKCGAPWNVVNSCAAQLPSEARDLMWRRVAYFASGVCSDCLSADACLVCRRCAGGVWCVVTTETGLTAVGKGDVLD